MKRALLIVLAAAALAVGCGKEPATLEELRAAGKTAYARQQYPEARKLLTRAVSQNPSDRESLYFLGLSYSADHQYDSALHYLKRVDLLFPNDRETNLKLYEVGMLTGEADIAAAAIGVLIATGDPAAQYYEDLARLHAKQEKFFLAHKYWRLLFESDPENPQRYLDFSASAAQVDSLDLALTVVDSAIARFGERQEFLLNKALFLVAKDRYVEGETILRRLAAADTAHVGYKMNLAHTLGLQVDDPAKLREALALYESLRGRVAAQFAVDSLIGVLKSKLGESL